MDPFSIVVGVGGLASIGVQITNVLITTIREVPNATNELVRCKQVTQELQEILQALENGDSLRENEFSLLASPLKGCILKCETFNKMLVDIRPSKGESLRNSVKDWTKLKIHEREIKDFQDAIAVYKSTITIALSGANLKYTKMTLAAFEKFTETIKDTIIGLQSRLEALGERWDKMQEQGIRVTTSSQDLPMDMQEEKSSILKCLEICEHVSSNIQALHADLTLSTQSLPAGEASNKTSIPVWSAKAHSLVGAGEQLERHLSRLSHALRHRAVGINETAEDKQAKKELLTEIENVKTAISISQEVENDIGKMRTNIIEDMTSGDDSANYVISEVGDLIHARRVNLGSRSLFVFGQVSGDSIKTITTSNHQSSAHINARGTNSEEVKNKGEPDSAFVNNQFGEGRSLRTESSSSHHRSHRTNSSNTKP